MATEYVDLSNNQNNFTKTKNDDTIKADTPLKSVAYNVIKNLQAQKLNTESDYKVDNLYFKKSETSDIKPPLLINKGNLPKEKLEIERLKKITGEYNLKNADPVKIDESMRLKNKTPDDYYHYSGDIEEEKKRIDEVFGPKTDFSISNFENNYDKFNQEEQEMITHKMQLELNSQGYTDNDGYKLKPDGIYGDKTKGAYEKYKKDNPEDYKDAVGNKETFNTSNLLYSVTSDEKPQVTYASSKEEPVKVVSLAKSNYSSDIAKKTEKQSVREWLETAEDRRIEKRLKDPVIKENADKVIEDNRESIKKAAEEKGVNPGILGSCIYAEHMRNVEYSDIHFDSKLAYLGFDTSLGVAQVKISTAKSIENAGYMPQITKNEEGKWGTSSIGYKYNSEREARINALLDPETNIMYAAAYLKYFQDRWKPFYPIIDGSTAVLATLFNQDEVRPPHGNPQPTPFGDFAKDSYYHINDLLGIK